MGLLSCIFVEILVEKGSLVCVFGMVCIMDIG